MRILFITMLALADREGCVYGSVAGLARQACLTREKSDEALERLGQPDQDSGDLLRNPENEGRRIEPLTTGGWRIVNYAYYRDLHDADMRRIKTARRVREHRARRNASNASNPSNPIRVSSTSAQRQLNSESLVLSTKKEREKTARSRSSTNGRFTPPTFDEIQAYTKARGIDNVDPLAFHSFYTAKDWMMGKTKMKNWKAAVTSWSLRER